MRKWRELSTRYIEECCTYFFSGRNAAVDVIKYTPIQHLEQNHTGSRVNCLKQEEGSAINKRVPIIVLIVTIILISDDSITVLSTKTEL